VRKQRRVVGTHKTRSGREHVSFLCVVLPCACALRACSSELRSRLSSVSCCGIARTRLASRVRFTCGVDGERARDRIQELRRLGNVVLSKIRVDLCQKEN